MMYKKALLVGLLLLGASNVNAGSSDLRYMKRLLIVCKYRAQWALEDCSRNVEGLGASVARVAFSVYGWFKGFTVRLLEGACAVPALLLREGGYLLSGY